MTAPQLPNGQKPKTPERALSDEQEWDRAYADALRSMRSIPDPHQFACTMELRHVEALADAIRIQGSWLIADPDTIRDLRLMGLVEAGTNKRHLTAFGLNVLRVIKDKGL